MAGCVQELTFEFVSDATKSSQKLMSIHVPLKEPSRYSSLMKSLTKSNMSGESVRLCISHDTSPPVLEVRFPQNGAMRYAQKTSADVGGKVSGVASSTD